MNKIIVYSLIGLAVIIILFILFSGNSNASAQTDTTFQDLGKVLSSGNEKCSKRCRLICKSHPFLRRGKCKRGCKADCGKGIDVSQKEY